MTLFGIKQSKIIIIIIIVISFYNSHNVRFWLHGETIAYSQDNLNRYLSYTLVSSTDRLFRLTSL